MKSITRSIYATTAEDLVAPDGSWDILVIRHRASTSVLLTGATTRPVTSVNEEGDELLCISFEPGVYLPRLNAAELRNRGTALARPDSRSFAILDEKFEIPDFENADDFVARLARAGLLARDELVASYFSGDPLAASERSVQRHFLLSTGLTPGFYRQLERARRAEALLMNGGSAADVALELGFSDQSHLTNSLKALLGRTPSRIRNGAPE